MIENGVDQIEYEALVNGPVGRIWELITGPDYLVQWYAFDGAEIDLRPGGHLAFRWKEHGEFLGRIENVRPPHELVFQFVGHNPGEAPQPDNSTRVTFTLEQKGAETRVCVVESGFLELANPREGDVAKSEISLQGWRIGMSAFAALARQL